MSYYSTGVLIIVNEVILCRHRALTLTVQLGRESLVDYPLFAQNYVTVDDVSSQQL